MFVFQIFLPILDDSKWGILCVKKPQKRLDFMNSNADEAVVNGLLKTSVPVLEASMNQVAKVRQTKQNFSCWRHADVQVSREIFEASENNKLLAMMMFLESYNGTLSFMKDEQLVSVFWVDSPFASCEMLSITLFVISLCSHGVTTRC